MKSQVLFLTAAIIFFSISFTVARSFRVSEIPNGDNFSCGNCHVSPLGGGARNAFGSIIEAQYLSAPGAAGHVQWGPALASLDSDGDGVSNGEELQDPNGLWTTGNPNPGNSSLVTNPGDPESFVPVELSAFSVSLINGITTINWSTATELNNFGFEIQRSSNLSDWDILSFVKGAGTTSERNSYNFSDPNPPAGKLFYRLRQIDLDGSYKFYGPQSVENINVNDFNLAQNYPNPFNPTTNIRFSLKHDSFIALDIYNPAGELVSTLISGNMEAGSHNIQFEAANMTSGIYIARLTSGEGIRSIKMMLLK